MVYLDHGDKRLAFWNQTHDDGHRKFADEVIELGEVAAKMPRHDHLVIRLEIRLVQVLPRETDAALPERIVGNQVMGSSFVQKTHVYGVAFFLPALEMQEDLEKHFVDHGFQTSDVGRGEEGRQGCTARFVQCVGARGDGGWGVAEAVERQLAFFSNVPGAGEDCVDEGGIVDVDFIGGVSLE